MMNRVDKVSPLLWAVAVKFIDEIIQKATRELPKEQLKGEPDQKSLSPSVTSQGPDKQLGEEMKHLPQFNVDCKVPQRVGSEDSGLCMRRSTGGCTPNHQKRPP
ncbi:UNVERIFIED_CONTAM: hypothetical protein FKN15_004230 [Acipenser sinensis]